MSAAKRYVIRIIGHGGQLIGHRYVLSYQAIGSVAAVSIPQAEMRRLLAETNGNTVAVLQPMAAALKAKGYETLMVLPAQTGVVDLVEVGGCTGETNWEALFDNARQLEIESAKLMLAAAATLERVEAFLEQVQSVPGAQELRHEVDAVANAVASAYVMKG